MGVGNNHSCFSHPQLLFLLKYTHKTYISIKYITHLNNRADQKQIWAIQWFLTSRVSWTDRSLISYCPLSQSLAVWKPSLESIFWHYSLYKVAVVFKNLVNIHVCRVFGGITGGIFFVIFQNLHSQHYYYYYYFGCIQNLVCFLPRKHFGHYKWHNFLIVFQNLVSILPRQLFRAPQGTLCLVS